MLTGDLSSRVETNHSSCVQMVMLVPMDDCHVDVFRDKFLPELGKWQKELQ
jgi:hypothetical protein